MVRVGRTLMMITAFPVMLRGDSGPAVCFPTEEPCSPAQRIPLGQPLVRANPAVWAGAELGFRYSLGSICTDLDKQSPTEKTGAALPPLWLLRTLLLQRLSLQSRKGQAGLQPRTQSPCHILKDTAILRCCHAIILEDEEERAT